MCEDEPEVVVLATKIMSRLIIVHGPAYSRKFADKSGGYSIMQALLKRWWNVPAVWPICFATLFGMDPSLLDLEKPFDRSDLLKLFLSNGDPEIMIPEMLTVITELMQGGLKKAVMASQIAVVDGKGSPSLQERLRKLVKPSMSLTTPVGKCEW